jgi:hypothetical protein
MSVTLPVLSFFKSHHLWSTNGKSQPVPSLFCTQCTKQPLPVY